MCIRDRLHGDVHEDADVILNLAPGELQVQLGLLHEGRNERRAPREVAVPVLVLVLDARDLVVEAIRE
eukprot:8374023-Prorocentrum_lima.AAC.1